MNNQPTLAELEAAANESWQQLMAAWRAAYEPIITARARALDRVIMSILDDRSVEL